MWFRLLESFGSNTEKQKNETVFLRGLQKQTKKHEDHFGYRVVEKFFHFPRPQWKMDEQ